jgi:aminopeptidase N
MKLKTLSLLLLACPAILFAQDEAQPVANEGWKKIYRASATITNDLVHTKIDAKFNYEKAWMNGKVWITAKPHLKATNLLQLDAKGMEIKEVAIMKGAVKSNLTYKYDGAELIITLDKSYKANEQYTVYIDYISKPNELKVKGSEAITDAKGLYFINPRGEEEGKHVEIWTQGETEATSVWCPTIDKTNQKTTQETYITVPAKYVTLSNGLLKSQKKNADGTRTDYWKMDLPHAPYLFFMGVGDYQIVKDSYKGKEVSYYVEKEYVPVARKIFGNTPEMMGFFSKLLGVEYPWSKYAQIVGRDYVSGAMENTTAVLHQESAYQNARELTDGNNWEGTIAHELFHHWFGDLVTAESWSNLTVNESFADYSQTLWDEYKYGKDAGDAENNQGLRGYLGNPQNAEKDLVRFTYEDKEQMFDGVSYQKGGRILHMLRNYLGDAAFFKGLNIYLTTNKFKTGEAHQLRLAFEDASGEDLNWFFNQWYFGNGHPELKIDYVYEANKAHVIVEQTQKSGKIFKLPFAIDIYTGTNKVRHQVWAQNKIDTFSFDISVKPDLINVDGDKILLATKKDNKTINNFAYQANMPQANYMDRLEAYDGLIKAKDDRAVIGLKDKFAPLRRSTIRKIGESGSLKANKAAIEQIEQLAATETNRLVKAQAIGFLAANAKEQYKPIFEKGIKDSSYSVAGEALKGLMKLDPDNAYTLAKGQTKDAKGILSDAVADVLLGAGKESDFDFVQNMYESMPPSQSKFDATTAFAGYVAKLNDMSKVEKSIKSIVAFRNMIPEQFRNFTDPALQQALSIITKAKGKQAQDIIDGLWK